MIFYLCNRKKCGDKCSYPECRHTADYAYALNKGVTPKVDDIFDEEYAWGHNLIEKEEREGLKLLP